MTLFQSIILGIVQGITEFLPISSSGHLIIFPKVFGWDEHLMAFDTTLHLGTAFAIVLYFWKDIYEIIRSLTEDIFSNKQVKNYSSNSKLAFKIMLGCIPAGILGLLLDDLLSEVFRSVYYVSLFLIIGSVLIFIAEKYNKKTYEIENISLKSSFIIGLFQALALFPGISRSGSTISGGMILGLDRKDAAKFSFLLSIPIILLAGIYKLYSSYNELLSFDLVVLLGGFISSFISGYLSIKILLSFVSKHKLSIFVFYRIVLAILLILFIV